MGATIPVSAPCLPTRARAGVEPMIAGSHRLARLLGIDRSRPVRQEAEETAGVEAVEAGVEVGANEVVPAEVPTEMAIVRCLVPQKRTGTDTDYDEMDSVMIPMKVQGPGYLAKVCERLYLAR